MKQSDMLTGLLKRNIDMIKRHLADFSEADMMVRPVPGANHAAWQMAHLAGYVVSTAKAIAPEANLSVPENLLQYRGTETSSSDDPAIFPTKARVLEIVELALNAQIGAVGKMSDEDLDKPTPEEFKRYGMNLAMMVLMGPLHTTMHMGQIQVIRRKLGKPVMF
jgi:DinB superfamily